MVLAVVPLEHPLLPDLQFKEVLADHVAGAAPTRQPREPLEEVVLMHPEVADRTGASRGRDGAPAHDVLGPALQEAVLDLEVALRAVNQDGLGIGPRFRVSVDVAVDDLRVARAKKNPAARV